MIYGNQHLHIFVTANRVYPRKVAAPTPTVEHEKTSSAAKSHIYKHDDLGIERVVYNFKLWLSINIWFIGSDPVCDDRRIYIYICICTQYPIHISCLRNQIKVLATQSIPHIPSNRKITKRKANTQPHHLDSIGLCLELCIVCFYLFLIDCHDFWKIYYKHWIRGT